MSISGNRARASSMVASWVTWLTLLSACACDRDSENQSGDAQPSSTPPTTAITSTASPTPSVSATSTASPASGAPARTAAAEAAPKKPSCPDGMQWIEGGEFWVGSEGSSGPKDEHPRFLTQMHGFCLDRTEVTAQAYDACVGNGQCTSAKRATKTCNAGKEERRNHPINCTSWEQADAYCAAQGKRLPTEPEWEYAARGGSEYRRFSWGNEAPDGHTCWKQPHSCEVGVHTEGAFGLHDMNGNVWEWTDSFYGAYPWPEKSAPHKVYRGGSWSRRFEKWMELTLRNRWGPDKFGSHLGFRCALLPEGSACPYGQSKDEQGRARCLRGVEQVECPPRHEWNGVRCLKQGVQADREDGCPNGSQAEPGYGCVSEGGRAVAAAPAAAGKSEPADPTAGVSMRRSPKFDADCKAYQPTRPKAFKLEGGSHHGRNLVARSKGCKNRDVGVGWNSSCCP